MAVVLLKGRNWAYGNANGVAWSGSIEGQTSILACGAWADVPASPSHTALSDGDTDSPDDLAHAAVPIVGTQVVVGTGDLLFFMAGALCPPNNRVMVHCWALVEDGL